MSQDIKLFFRAKLALVKTDHDGLCTPWPDERTIEKLVARAAGLFIHAATTCRFIRNADYRPDEQLSLILVESSGANLATAELDAMYRQVLVQSVIGGRGINQHAGLLGRFGKSIWSMVVMFDVMAINDLAALSRLETWKLKRTLASLDSVLNVPKEKGQPIRILHPSFRNFLVNADRCCDEKFCIDEQGKHSDLFRNCMELMLNTLRRDICVP